MNPCQLCYSCGKLGSVRKRSKTPSGRLRLLMICYNPACRFDFITHEGRAAMARPQWSYVPQRSET